MTDEQPRKRVRAMAPDDRRAALVEATVPLLYAHGPDVSTRQIATAAGVAEGTIFGVFPDKNSLVVAALMRALDPQPTIDALDAIDRRKDLRARLVEAAEMIHGRFARNAGLMNAARTLVFSDDAHSAAALRMISARDRLHTALSGVVHRDEGKLRRSADDTARLLLLYTGANAFGPFGDAENFDAAATVSLLLDGLLIEKRPSGLVVPHTGGER